MQSTFKYNKMKNNTLSLLLITAFQLAFGQYVDKTETPYIKAKTEDGMMINVPLESVNVKVNIAGIIADVFSTQVYNNTSNQPVSAQYVFPGSTHAAVYGMTMKIGNRIINAKIKEKEQATEEFKNAVNQGKTASLLQQHRPNVFQMDIGNIPAKTKVEIELQYTELLQPEEGIYEFVYPTIVGKRFDQEVEGTEQWTLNPYANLDQGNKPRIDPPKFDVQVSLQTPIPIQGLKIPSHKVKVEYLNRKKAQVDLDNGNQTENKDFVLKYKLKGDRIETGIMLWEGEDENFFLYMGESPKRINPDEIPPREYFFIVDVSGSMNGFPLDISKTLMKNILNDLKPIDKFNVMLFAASSEVLFDEPQNATALNIKNAIGFLDHQNGIGGTHLLGALQEAFDHVNQTSSTSFVILTDGFVTVEKNAFDFISKNLHAANFFPIGIGSSVNRYLIEGLAHIGQTEPFFIMKPEQGTTISEKFKNYVSSPVLTNIKIQFDDFQTYDVIPQSIPDMLGERPVISYGKWKGKPKGEFLLTGNNAKGEYQNKTKVNQKLINSENKALRHLWARKKLQILSDYNTLSRSEDFKEKITEIGLKYSLLSEFTSFLAIDDNNQAIEQKQENVPATIGSVPEPHEWALIALTAIFVSFAFLKSRITG